MARTPVGSEVPAAALKEASQDWIARSKGTVNMTPSYVKAGDDYYSAADLFMLLANYLGELSKTGKAPQSVKLTNVYGPLILRPAEETVPTAVFSCAAVMKAAAELVPRLNDPKWRPVPANMIPWKVEIEGKRLNPAQFLALMVDAYLAGTPDAQLHLRYLAPWTAPGYEFPRQSALDEGGNTWTLRPAPLKLN